VSSTSRSLTGAGTRPWPSSTPRSTDFESLLTASQNAAVVRRVIREASEAHRHIGEAINRGSAPQVRRAAEAHLNQVEALMVAQMT